MNAKTVNIIAASVLGLFNVTAFAVHLAANKHAKANAKIKAIGERPEEIKELIEAANNRCDIYKRAAENEKLAFEKRVKDWKVASDFDSRRYEFLNNVSDGLEKFKDEIGYYNDCDAIDDEFKAAVEAFKNTIDYDSEEKKLKELIKEAESHFEKQKALFDAAGDDISETAMKLRHAEEEAMTVKVKEAKSKLEALEKQLKEETEKLQKNKTDKIRVLEEKISKEKIRLDKKANKDLDKLNAELSNAEEGIWKDIRKGRSGEEKAAFAKHEDDIRFIREKKEESAKLAKKIYEDMPEHAKLANFFVDHKVPKFVVGFVGFLPMVAAAVFFWRYEIFVFRVLNGMGCK